MLNELIQEPIFGITLTLLVYFLGLFLYKKEKKAIFHPILMALFIIISFLTLFDIDYESYNNGGQYISILLGPATVALAIPMYRKITLLKKYTLLILLSTFLSSLIAILLTIGLGMVFNTNLLLLISMIPKSVTTPIAVGISEQIGGEIALTAGAVIITGLLGGMFGPELNRLFRIKSTLARGLTMGITAHGIGTARALTEDEQEGALSGLAIGLMGIFTAINAPIVLYFLRLIWPL